MERFNMKITFCLSFLLYGCICVNGYISPFNHYGYASMDGEGVTSHGGDLLRSLALFRMLGSEMGKKILDEAERMKEDDRIYNFGTFLVCDCGFEYIGEDGQLKGFLIDLINKVCSEAGKRCTIQSVSYSDCFHHGNGQRTQAGIGLLAKHVDMCMYWFKTTERLHVASYSESFGMMDNSASFYVKRGNPNNFDPSNIAGKKIGFKDGIASDFDCMMKSQDIKKNTGIKDIFYANTQELLQDALDGKIDAMYLLKTTFDGGSEFEAIGSSVSCSGGDGKLHGVTRKDNELQWFDQTLRTMKESGQYDALCYQAKIQHGHKGEIHCL